MRITTSARSPIEERITLEERMPAELAATRVQAVARGRRTRKTLSIIAEASSTPEVAATSEPPTSTAAAAGATTSAAAEHVRTPSAAQKAVDETSLDETSLERAAAEISADAEARAAAKARRRADYSEAQEPTTARPAAKVAAAPAPAEVGPTATREPPQHESRAKKKMPKGAADPFQAIFALDDSIFGLGCCSAPRTK